jgi:hypothetical protein
MGTDYLENIYCGLWLQSNRENWELWYSLYKSQGSKAGMVYPAKTKSLFEEVKMKELFMYYINNPTDNRICLPFDPNKRLVEECYREPVKVFRVFWHSHHVKVEFEEFFITCNEQGQWVEIEKPEGLLNYPDYQARLEQIKMDESKRKSSEEFIKKKQFAEQEEKGVEESLIEKGEEPQHVEEDQVHEDQANSALVNNKMLISQESAAEEIPEENKNQLSLF